MKHLRPKLPPGDQAGFMNILLVVVVMGVSAGLLQLLNKRVEHQLRYVAHEELQFELDLLKRVVTNKAECLPCGL